MWKIIAALVILSVSPALADETPDPLRYGAPQWYQGKPLEQTHQRVARYVRERVASLGSRPAGCPSAWCGCWLARHLGLSDSRLNRAREWAHRGSNAGGPAPGVIAVWPHHVGKVTAVDGRRIKVLSGNDGHAVRERWRSAAGVIAWRRV